MTNWEKYEDEILKVEICGSGFGVTKEQNTPVPCDETECSECKFDNAPKCSIARYRWLNEEYTEPKKPEIDWSKVPVDTPVIVSSSNGFKYNRYFAKYVDGKIYTWVDGKTSWSVKTANDINNMISWLDGIIAPGIDCGKWYKEE